MFDSKKDAEEHDRMLELAANITCFIERELGLKEADSEAVGLLLAKHREVLAVACKGKPSALLEIEADSPPAEEAPKRVASLVASA